MARSKANLRLFGLLHGTAELMLKRAKNQHLQAELQRRISSKILSTARNAESSTSEHASTAAPTSSSHNTNARGSTLEEKPVGVSKAKRPRAASTPRSAPEDSYVVPPNSWPVQLQNLPRTVLREDILNFLPPLGITTADIRPAWTYQLRIHACWIALRSEEARKAALAKNGHYLGLRNVLVLPGSVEEMQRRLTSRHAATSEGRYVLITGLDGSARIDDVMSLFLEYDILSKAINLFESWSHTDAQQQAKKRLRRASEAPKLMDGLGAQSKAGQEGGAPEEQAALVRFRTNEEANRAVRNCNHMFVKTKQIKMRVLI